MNVQTFKNILKNNFLQYYRLILRFRNNQNYIKEKISFFLFFTTFYLIIILWNLNSSVSKFWLTRLASVLRGVILPELVIWIISWALLEIVSTNILLAYLNYGTLIPFLCLLIVICLCPYPFVLVYLCSVVLGK